jgi:chromosome segregation ATPase
MANPSKPAGTLSALDQEAQDVLSIADDLRRQLEQSWEMIQALNEDLAAARDLHKRAETLAESRARELERVKAETAAATARAEQLATELGASEEERAEAVTEIRRLQEALEDAVEKGRSVTEQLQKQIRDADEGSRKAVEDQTRLKAAIADLEQRVETLENVQEQRTRDLAQAHLTIEEITQERDDLREQVADLEQSRAALGRIHTTLSDIRAKVSREHEPSGVRSPAPSDAQDRGAKLPDRKTSPQQAMRAPGRREP